MTTQYYTLRQTELWEKPRTRKVCDLPPCTIVEMTDEMDFSYVRVIYRTNTDRYGWVYLPHVESLIDEFPRGVVSIGNPTPNPQDAAQYVIWLGNIQYNLCGEFCVSYVFGDSIETVRGAPFLTRWQAKPTSFYNRVFHGGRARGTSADELVDMVSVYGADTVALRTLFYDRYTSVPLVVPSKLESWVQMGWFPIAGVRIDPWGNLAERGVLHWVVVDSVVPDGMGRGWVTVYNPFPNQRQRYSWAEFARSMGAPYGIAVKDTQVK